MKDSTNGRAPFDSKRLLKKFPLDSNKPSSLTAYYHEGKLCAEVVEKLCLQRTRSNSLLNELKPVKGI